MTSTVTVYQADTQAELGRFDPGTREADLWQELVTPSAKGRLLRSNGVWVTQGSTTVAQGNYYLHAVEAAGPGPPGPGQPTYRSSQGGTGAYVTPPFQGNTAVPQGNHQYQAAYAAGVEPAPLQGPSRLPFRSLHRPAGNDYDYDYGRHGRVKVKVKRPGIIRTLLYSAIDKS